MIARGSGFGVRRSVLGRFGGRRSAARATGRAGNSETAAFTSELQEPELERRPPSRRAPSAERRLPCILLPMPSDIDAAVISNARLSDDYCIVSLEAPEIAALAQPGQFVMVKPSRGMDPLLRRPFSIFEILRDREWRTGWHLSSEQAHRDRHEAVVRSRTGRAPRLSGTPRAAVRARRSCDAGVDGCRGRGARAVSDACGSAARERHAHDALLRRPARGRAL